MPYKDLKSPAALASRRAAVRRYQKRNPEDTKRRKSESQKKNREAASARVRRWRERHRDEYLIQHRDRMALYRGRGVGGEYVDSLILLELDDGICAICGEDVDPFDFHIEHDVPISRGGFNNYANTHVAHEGCNFRKHKSTLEELRGEQNP